MTSAPLGERMTLPASARYLGMSVAALEGMVRRGQIPFHRFAPRGRRYFYESELEAFVASTRVAAAPSPRPPVVTPVTRPRRVDHLMPAVREFV